MGTFDELAEKDRRIEELTDKLTTCDRVRHTLEKQNQDYRVSLAECLKQISKQSKQFYQLADSVKEVKRLMEKDNG